VKLAPIIFNPDYSLALLLHGETASNFIDAATRAGLAAHQIQSLR